MKRVLTGCVTLALSILLSSYASAQYFNLTSGELLGRIGGSNAGGCDSGACDSGGCDTSSCDSGGYTTTCCTCSQPQCCCDQSCWFCEGEATFFRYHRADGVRVGGEVEEFESNYDLVEFDFEASPRLAIGYISPDGLGVRARCWKYKHTAIGTEDFPRQPFISVDTYTIDFEVLERLCVGCYSTLEISAGMRYNYFEETIFDEYDDNLQQVRFKGFGGMVGAQLNRRLAVGGALYVRARGTILMDDKDLFTVDDSPIVLSDTTVGVTEIGFGYIYSQCLRSGAKVSANFGVEWQNWYNYSNTMDTQVDIRSSEDVGFGGMLVGIGLER